MSLSVKSKKTLLLVVILLVLIVGALFKLSGGVLVFSYLKPTYLPLGISIKGVRIIATKADVFTELNFRTEDWVYGVQEYRAQPLALPVAKGDYNSSSVSQTCSILTSPHQQRYRLCHSVDYGKISVFEVTQIDGKVLISSRIPTVVGRQIGANDIGKFVDSFKRTPRLFAPTFRHDGP